MRIGRLTKKAPLAGRVIFDDERASPMKVLLIAAAGPAASALCALPLGWAALRADGSLNLVLWLMAVAALLHGLSNLRPKIVRHADGAETSSDGRVIARAWAALRDPSPPQPAES